MFAIDSVNLPSNANKERSGTIEELPRRAQRLNKAADNIARLRLRQSQDKATQEAPLSARGRGFIDASRREALKFWHQYI